MQARNFIGSALLAAGMLVSGGGGATVEASEPGHLATNENVLPDGTGQDYEYTYYNEPAKMNVIGGRGRAGGAWFRWGTTSAYYDYSFGTWS